MKHFYNAGSRIVFVVNGLRIAMQRFEEGFRKCKQKKSVFFFLKLCSNQQFKVPNSFVNDVNENENEKKRKEKKYMKSFIQRRWRYSAQFPQARGNDDN